MKSSVVCLDKGVSVRDMSPEFRIIQYTVGLSADSDPEIYFKKDLDPDLDYIARLCYKF